MENIFKCSSFSTGHQRVIAKERGEETKRIKIQSHQYLSLLLDTKLLNETFFLKKAFVVFHRKLTFI